jgi:hypothetical protein
MLACFRFGGEEDHETQLLLSMFDSFVLAGLFWLLRGANTFGRDDNNRKLA